MDHNFDEEIWVDINAIFADDEAFDLSNEVINVHKLQFGVPLASGFRFRYHSEIEKRSISSMKGDNNQSPTLLVQSSSDVVLRLDLVTEMSSSEASYPHFYTLYEVAKLTDGVTFIDGVCEIPIKQNCLLELKLDNIGIRKWTLKESMHRIQQKYPEFSEKNAKKFFNESKESVKLRASLFDSEYVVSSILSNTIKSQVAKENKLINIQHICPKTVADYNESLIIVLEKKITCKSCTFLEFDNGERIPLTLNHGDGQTFVYNLPPYNQPYSTVGRIRIECEDHYDEKPIRFISVTLESRKRKNIECRPVMPLKKTLSDQCSQPLVPESGSNDMLVEFDGPTSNEDRDVFDQFADAGHTSGNESCKDSGIFSADRTSLSGRSYDHDEESYDSSDESLDDIDDDIDIEGGRRARVNRVENLEPINFPPSKRDLDSRLQSSKHDKVTDKIFSEVARIGHDFAFGKQPIELFSRIEKQLPVVFTLQDDVGDTPLNNAILKGNVLPAERILKIVHDECNWALNIANTSGHTALILAPACDVPDSFIMKLLDAGCRLDILDDLGKSAITYAIEYKNTTALSVLLQHVKKHHLKHLLERHERNYFSYLQTSVLNSYVDGVDLLVNLKDDNGEYMIDVNEHALMNEDTALHMAVERNVGTDIIRLLLQRPDININHMKNETTTVLHTAYKLNLTEVVSLLEEHHAEDINAAVELEEVNDVLDYAEDDTDENTDAMITSCEISPAVETIPECGTEPSNIASLTGSMENMSIKGVNRSRLIEILLNGYPILRVDEVAQVIKPVFQALVNKYSNSDTNRSELVSTLNRFDCWPNSIGQLFAKLREINRQDIITKVLTQFNF